MNIFFSRRRHFLICSIFLIVCGNCSENKDSQSADTQTDSTHLSYEESRAFSIQVAALKDKNNADNLSDALRKSELPVYVLSDSTLSGDSFF